MNLKKVLPLVAAIVLGLLAAWEVQRIAASKNTASKVKETEIVVVKQDVPAGQALTTDDLTLGELAAGATPSTSAYTDPAELIGRVPTIPLIAGQAVTDSLLAPKGSGSGLQAVIPSGMRAITIEIDEFSGVAFYLVPGCHVDILHSGRDDRSGVSYTKTIIQNVQVLAVGTRPNPGDNSPQQARSVTLLVTPRQAEIIALSAANGRPRFVLRNSEDHANDAAPGVTMAALMVPAKAVPAPAPTPVMATAKPLITDIFGAGITSHPKAPEFWSMRVITGGVSSSVEVKLPSATSSSGDEDSASNDTGPATPAPH